MSQVLQNSSVRYNVHMATKVITVTHARRKIFELVDDIQYNGDRYFIAERGIPKVVFMSLDEYESLLETIDVLAENPNLLEEIKESQEQYARGETYSLEEVVEDLDLNIAPKYRNETATNKKRKKRTRKTS